MEDLHLRLRELRRATNHLQEHVATALGISRSAVVEIEAGNRKISAIELIKLGEFYQISLDELVYGKETEDVQKAFTCYFNKLSKEDKTEILYIMKFKNSLSKDI